MSAPQLMVLRSGPGAAAWNMALDHALWEETQRDHAVLRFYSWTEPAATFGYFQKWTEVEVMTALRPLIRRPTGGGVVPHDADWTYSLVFPESHPWYRLNARESYRKVHEWIQKSFRAVNVEAEVTPCCVGAGTGRCFDRAEMHDLVRGSVKLAGAAQRRGRHGLLIQGSIQPGNVSVNRNLLEEALVSEACRDWAGAFVEIKPSEDVVKQAHELEARMYSSEQHHRRR